MHWIDPLSLPSTAGDVARFLFNAEGHADGFLLTNGQQVHFPPHLSQALLARVRVGSSVLVRGFKPRRADVLVALSLTTHAGHTLEDSGAAALGQPKGYSGKPQPVQLDGVVTRRIYAPHGEVCGALLEDGTLLRMHAKGNEKLQRFLQPGLEVTVWGDQIRVHGQTVIDIAYLALA